MIPWMQISSVADSVVTLPAAAIIALWLVAGRAWRMALGWCLLFSVGLAIVAATKIAFIGWGIGIGAIDFMGMSGHAMRATAVFPVIFYLALQRSSNTARTWGVLFGICAGLLVGISRLALDVHTMSEVITGCAMGATVSLSFIWISRDLTKPQLSRSLIALGLCALLPASYANPAPTNRWMSAVALYLSGSHFLYDRTSGKVIAIDEDHAP